MTKNTASSYNLALKKLLLSNIFHCVGAGYVLSLRAFQEMIAFLKDKEGELLSLKVIYKKDMKRRSTFMTVLKSVLRCYISFF